MAPFNKEMILDALPELTADTIISHPEISKYRQFYGLDFEITNERISVSLGQVTVGDYQIVVHTFTPEKPKGTVYVVHGYCDHVGIYNHLIGYLINLGFAVVAFDLPGHGLSTGDVVAIGDFEDYQTTLSAVLAKTEQLMPKPWHVVAQSTGGAIVVDMLLSGQHNKDSSPFQKVFLLAPLVRPSAWLTGRVTYYLIRPFRQYIKRKFSVNSNDKAFLHFQKSEDPLQSKYLSAQWVGALIKWIPFIESRRSIDLPVTIIQGKQDGTVDWRHNIKVLEKKFKGSEVLYFSNARHHLVNEIENERELIFEVVGGRIS